MADAPRSPVSPDFVSDCDKTSYGNHLAETDKCDSDDYKSPPPSKRQYSCKLDKDGVLRYRPEPGDYEPESPIEAPACFLAVCDAIPEPKPPTKHVAPSQLKRHAPEECPGDEDESKLTWAPKKKPRKDKAKGKTLRESKARFVSLYGGDIDENSSVVEVGRWVQGIDLLWMYAIECSEIFVQHKINGSDLLEMTGETIKKLDLTIGDREIILDCIDTLKAKSKANKKERARKKAGARATDRMWSSVAAGLIRNSQDEAVKGK